MEKSILSKISHDKEMIKKILITLGIIVVYKLMSFIPIPGINLGALQKFFNMIKTTQGSTLLGMDMFSGEVMSRLTIFALGLIPYFSSCILILLLGSVTPFFRKYYVMGGQEGREKIVKSAYYLTIALSVIQAFFISLWLENPAHFQGLNIVSSPGWGFRIIAVVSITAGVLLLLWLAKLITKYGFGNGVAILVLSGITLNFLGRMQQLIMLHVNYSLIGQLIILLLILIVSIVVIWLVTKSTQKISVTYNNSKIKNSITLRFSWAGKAPLGFAQAIILFPATIAAFSLSLNKLATQISRSGWLYTIVYPILIMFFTYFCIAIVFGLKNIINNMRKYNCQVENVALGGETEKYLDAKMTKNTMMTALFLIAVAVLPDMYRRIFKLPYSAVGFIGGTSLIMMIGVFYDLKCQIESYFTMKESHNEDKWEVAYIAFDEIEAEIKKGFLVTKGIPCVIEPLRFTWGMLIKTAVDQYRLYVPSRKRNESRELLTY